MRLYDQTCNNSRDACRARFNDRVRVKIVILIYWNGKEFDFFFIIWKIFFNFSWTHFFECRAVHPFNSWYRHSSYTTFGFDWFRRVVNVGFRCWRSVKLDNGNKWIFRSPLVRVKNRVKKYLTYFFLSYTADEISLKNFLHFEIVWRLVVMKIFKWWLKLRIFVFLRCWWWTSESDIREAAAKEIKNERWFHYLKKVERKKGKI